MSQRNDFDPYDVLGVLPGASPEVIKAAYLAATKATHPDVQGASAAATQRQQALNDAYDILKNPAKRAAYDAQLKGAFDGGPPKTMDEARRRVAEAESTAQSLKAALEAERRKTTSRLDAELQAQLLNLQQTNYSNLHRQALNEAWAEIGDAVTSAIKARDELIDQLSRELADAEGQLVAPRQPPTSERDGPARRVLAGLLVAAFLGAGLYWLWQAFVLVVGAWYGAPGQALWPAVLRNPWAVIAIIVVTTFVLGLAPTRTLERESLWMLLWPALAIVIWVLAQPVAFGTQLWGGAVDQITRYVVGYLASFLLAWLCVAAVPD